MARVPFPPFDDRPIDPYRKARANCGANFGVCENKGIVFAHSMYGTLAGTDAYFRRLDVCSLTPWGIGGAADGALDGKIYRWMDYSKYNDVQPWSSGSLFGRGEGDGPAFLAKYGVAGINGYGQAIENSDGGSRQLPMTVKQWESFIWLMAAIAHNGTLGITSKNYREYLAFMEHWEITTKAVKSCPFPRISNYANEYIGAAVALMAFFEENATDLNKLVFNIAGKVIDLRHVGRLVPGGYPVPTPPAGPVFVDYVPDKTLITKYPATVRQYGWRGAKVYGTIEPDTEVLVQGYYLGETVYGSNRWVVQAHEPRGRIHESAFGEIPDK